MLCLVAEKVGETSTNSPILIHLLACSALCHKTDVKWKSTCLEGGLCSWAQVNGLG